MKEKEFEGGLGKTPISQTEKDNLNLDNLFSKINLSIK